MSQSRLVLMILFSDIKIPSEHTLCGTRYPGEYSIYIVHPDRKQTVAMSILLAFHKDDKPNSHLQTAIDEWQKVYEDNEYRCKMSTQKRSLKLNPKMHFAESFRMRNLTDTTPFGTGGWDPFDPSLVTTIYHWGYWGSCEFGDTVTLYYILFASYLKLDLLSSLYY